ncbi:Stk1 family PASTA domain-containing Ser/Thr kinase [Demequina sp. NBRC 110057]|uniref:Stk1 family PASTA domain-containing Ser/Thr kinase n=1 Tax=Demequina sp. NBRC 110057 TaxID=1570346 RepID=UPI001356394E|nr:Stk1 family PASTA domain-containing Ser/Thr kinase [Demequina sp. NBRC 110057]
MSETLTDPLLGRVIDGRYEVRERVAAGGMATVYVAFDRRLERDVALKVMHPHLAADASEADFVARFRREAKAAARLTHPGMVRVYDQGVDGSISYLTMEYVGGENLRQRMTHEGPLTVGESLGITERVLDALAAAHRADLVHRDVKPENVLLDEEGGPKLTDFGLARAVTEVTSTATGTLLGTVAYLAPEVVTEASADARADVYSTGILLFEMITGRQPFTGETALAVASRHVHEDVPPPSELVPWLPVEIDDLVALLTARDIDDRPADAAAALVAVRTARSALDDPTLDRQAARPAGSEPPADDHDHTTVLEEAPAGATIALPIGLDGQATALTVTTDPPEDDPEAAEPVRHRHRAGWWIGAIIAAIIVLGSLVVWWYQAIGPGAYTTVTDVAGLTEDQATATLEGLGFTVSTEDAFDDVVAEGIVISTDPSKNARALDGAEIIVTVSQGPRMSDVPDVVGSTQDDAEEQLTDEGFGLGETEHEYSDTAAAGEVLSMSPEAGESVRHDTIVTLTVSDGPEPITTPDLTGMTQDEAVATLAELGIEPTIATGRTEAVATGEVYEQTPAAGTDGFRTQEMSITVSEGLPLVTIQDVRGMGFDEAKAALEAQGLTVTGDDNPWNFSTVVFNMDPGPNTQVERGTSVYLEY